MYGNAPTACTFCGDVIFGVLTRKLDHARTPACKECYRLGLASGKYNGPSVAEKYFWELKTIHERTGA